MSDPLLTIASMMNAIDYAEPGPLTGLGGVRSSVLDDLPRVAVEICRIAGGLVIHPLDAEALGVPADRFGENQARAVGDLVAALLVMDPAPLSRARVPECRVIGTCRHFAVLTCALLRYRGIAARARCGFASYFQPGRGVDHWITEYWHERENRWVRVDSEVLGLQVLDRPEDLGVEQFLTGGEAWAAFRGGQIDAAQYGVYGTANWGPAEIRGNAIRDLAALNKVEMLPWDEWGRMHASYVGETGDEYDEILDTIAAVCAEDDASAVMELYGRDELRVPQELIR
jgi:Transglutaminase-like superfamily